MRSKIGKATWTIPKIAAARNGRIAISSSVTFTLMANAMMTEKMNIMGLRTATRMIIMKAFCTLVTSVVSLVIILAVENLSILAKENRCTL